MSSLHCLQLDPSLRTRVADALVPITKMKAGKGIALKEEISHVFAGYIVHYISRARTSGDTCTSEEALDTSCRFGILTLSTGLVVILIHSQISIYLSTLHMHRLYTIRLHLPLGSRSVYQSTILRAS